MNLLLFKVSISEQRLESAIDLPGFSHAGESVNVRVSWYPFEEQFRKVYFFAKHRRQAAKHLERFCGQARDLDEGRRCDNLIADHHRRQKSLQPQS